MIERVDSVPEVAPERSAMREFAADALRGVLELGPGSYEVTEWPRGDAAQLCAAIRREAWSMGVSKRVRAMRRRGQVFVEVAPRGGE